MSTLPPLVHLTPASLRLTRPLVLRVPAGGLQLGPGWQLAANTTIGSGAGVVWLDLTAVTWDAEQINLRLETWGSIRVVIPRGVTVQVLGGSASVQLESLAAPIPGGPLLRVSASGPTGVIRICHPKVPDRRPLGRWRRSHAAVDPSSHGSFWSS